VGPDCSLEKGLESDETHQATTSYAYAHVEAAARVVVGVLPEQQALHYHAMHYHAMHRHAMNLHCHAIHPTGQPR